MVGGGGNLHIRGRPESKYLMMIVFIQFIGKLKNLYNDEYDNC